MAEVFVRLKIGGDNLSACDCHYYVVDGLFCGHGGLLVVERVGDVFCGHG
jgi:hypothetical protein